MSIFWTTCKRRESDTPKARELWILMVYKHYTEILIISIAMHILSLFLFFFDIRHLLHINCKYHFFTLHLSLLGQWVNGSAYTLKNTSRPSLLLSETLLFFYFCIFILQTSPVEGRSE